MPKLGNLHAMAFFDGANSYRVAANKLRELMPSSGLPLRDPAYFLYHHAVELALKACMLSHGATIPTGRTGHDISACFHTCKTRGFLKLKDDKREINNLIVFLGAGANGIDYRYPGPILHAVPELNWVDEVIVRLMEAVSLEVSVWAKNNNVPALSRNRLTLGKPVITKQAVPLKPGP